MKWVKKNKREVSVLDDPKKAVKGSDVILSDKVFSLNDKTNKLKKINDFKNYKINSNLMSYAKKNAIFLHCLLEAMRFQKKFS